MKKIFFILIVVVIVLFSYKFINTNSPQITPPVTDQQKFTGQVLSGSNLDIKKYCPEGLYLNTAAKPLLLRLPNDSNPPKMLSDQKYQNKIVEIIGLYPAQDSFCEALTCQCEDYILVSNIDILEDPTLK